MNKIKAIWNFFFGFKGRINRTHYLIFLIFYIPIFVVTTATANLAIILGIKVIFDESSFSEILYILLARIFSLIILILFMLFKYSHLIRRVHDFNKFALESVLLIAIILADIVSFILAFGKIYSPLNLIIVGILLICFISLAFIKGTQGDNNFGSPQIPFWKRSKIDN